MHATSDRGKELGFRPDPRIVIVCAEAQVQQTARALLTLEQFGLGRRASILYDGSFEDWSGREAMPVVSLAAVAKQP